MLHEMMTTFNNRCHRDLKPENIIIKHQDNDKNNILVSLANFGFANVCDQPTGIMGTI